MGRRSLLEYMSGFRKKRCHIALPRDMPGLREQFFSLTFLTTNRSLQCAGPLSRSVTHDRVDRTPPAADPQAPSGARGDAHRWRARVARSNPARHRLWRCAHRSEHRGRHRRPIASIPCSSNSGMTSALAAAGCCMRQGTDPWPPQRNQRTRNRAWCDGWYKGAPEARRPTRKPSAQLPSNSSMPRFRTAAVATLLVVPICRGRFSPAGTARSRQQPALRPGHVAGQEPVRRHDARWRGV